MVTRSPLLSPTAPAPRTHCIGEGVARFAGPFESRPTDPVRRELFRQLARPSSSPSSAASSGWLAPVATLPTSPRPLPDAIEASHSGPKPRPIKGRRRFPLEICPHPNRTCLLAKLDVPSGEVGRACGRNTDVPSGEDLT